MRGVSTRPSPWFLALVAVTVAGGVLAAVGTQAAVETGQSTVLTLGLLLLVMGGWAVTLCLHEFAHAFTAYRSGDTSVRAKGYLTLDIRRYTDIGMSLVLPLIFLLLGGIPLPGGAVWINHGALRSPVRRSLVSLAGPVTNLAAGLVLIAVTHAVSMPAGLEVGLATLGYFQVIAFFLNVLPIPGLDGWGVIEPFVAPRGISPQVRTWAPLVFFLLLISFAPVREFVFGVSSSLFTLLGGDLRDAAAGQSLMQFWNRLHW